MSFRNRLKLSFSSSSKAHNHFASPDDRNNYEKFFAGTYLPWHLWNLELSCFGGFRLNPLRPLLWYRGLAILIRCSLRVKRRDKMDLMVRRLGAASSMHLLTTWYSWHICVNTIWGIQFDGLELYIKETELSWRHNFKMGLGDVRDYSGLKYLARRTIEIFAQLLSE